MFFDFLFILSPPLFVIDWSIIMWCGKSRTLIRIFGKKITDGTYTCIVYILLLPHPFPLVYGVDGSYETPPFNSVLRDSSPDNYLSDKSFLMLSNHLRFDLPLLLFPGTTISITLLPTYSSSRFNTGPYHLNFIALSLIFSHLRCPSNYFVPNSV